MVAIHEWIAQDNERAAERVVSRLLQTAMMFGQFPKLGRLGEVAGTRVFAVAGLPYRIIFAIAPEGEIDVLTVLHTRRNYPPV
ncbi:type II toxin-antitoxin system RelE/ParE family toxin [Sphingomonas sp. PB4P5]|uniref:type II toxin-antitoxin system RelE/ParE family toxin n=1 Tax=Parasphingomonas puruogangriensis TaxID=3096155 RepID=UPI002FCC51DC